MSVTIYLTQQDIDLIDFGMPIDIQTPDHKGGTLSVHVIRDRMRQWRRPTGSMPLAHAAS